MRDLLHHYPRRCIDRSQVAAIRDLRVGQQATVIAKVKNVEKRQTRHRRSMVTVTRSGTEPAPSTWSSSISLGCRHVPRGNGAGRVGDGRPVRSGGCSRGARRSRCSAARGSTRCTPAASPRSSGDRRHHDSDDPGLVYQALLELPEVPDPVPSAIVETACPRPARPSSHPLPRLAEAQGVPSASSSTSSSRSSWGSRCRPGGGRDHRRGARPGQGPRWSDSTSSALRAHVRAAAVRSVRSTSRWAVGAR